MIAPLHYQDKAMIREKVLDQQVRCWLDHASVFLVKGLAVKATNQLFNLQIVPLDQKTWP